MDQLIRAIVTFSVAVVMFWCGVSVVQWVRLDERALRQTRKGKWMVWTALGTLAVAGIVVAAAVGRWIASMMGV